MAIDDEQEKKISISEVLEIGDGSTDSVHLYHDLFVIPPTFESR
jgi:hypothetical protein